jgi:nucleoid-associated protein EbfC
MSKGFNGVPSNMQGLMKKVQKMQDDIMHAQKEVDAMTFEGQAGGGVVRIEMTGDNDPKKVYLNPEIVNKDDISMLEDLILAAMRDAYNKVKNKKKESIDKATGGMPIPPGLL